MILHKLRRGISVLLLSCFCLFSSGCDFDFLMFLWSVFHGAGKEAEQARSAPKVTEAEPTESDLPPDFVGPKSPSQEDHPHETTVPKSDKSAKQREEEAAVDRFDAAEQIGLLPGQVSEDNPFAHSDGLGMGGLGGLPGIDSRSMDDGMSGAAPTSSSPMGGESHHHDHPE